MTDRKSLVAVDPLQNDEILEQIFKSLPLEGLLSSRLVCRAWRRESSKAMRSCAKVSFYVLDNTSEIQKFLDLVKSKESIFTKKPFVNSYSIRALIGKTLNIPKFWTFCGNNIKTLQLHSVRFASVNAFQNVIHNRCPNLEKLILEQIQVGYGAPSEPTAWVAPRHPQNWNLKTLKLDIVSCLEVSWMEILAHFPALENLDVKCSHPGLSIDDKLFRSFALARQHNDQCWKLKSFETNLGIITESPHMVSLLGNGNLALEKLVIVDVASKHLTAVQRILKGQASSLKFLGLSAYERQHNDVVNILPSLENIYFEKLEEIELANVSVYSTKFLRCVPNLERLKFSQISNSFEQDGFDEDNWLLPNCTELELNLRIDCKPEKLEHLWRRLPNVKTLKLVGVGNRMFGVICGLWEHVTFLNVSKSDINDSGISGFDESDVKKINQKGPAGDWRPKTVPRANITSFKHLKSLHWENDNKSRLDYCAAVYGIQQLPELEHLRMDGYPKVDWSQICNQFPWK